MSGSTMPVPRFVLRLAEGAMRSRLVEPILSARPPLVVVSAPSGYGKTVLAAQVASSGAFAQVVWIRGAGAAGSLRDALVQVTEQLTGEPLSPDVQSLPDICHACGVELAAMPDNHSLLVVLDDANWAGDPQSLGLLEEVLSDAPLGTTSIVTTRVDILANSHASAPWVISTVQLMLTESEILEVWGRHVKGAPTSAQVDEIADASGRHAALVTLMARHALSDGPLARISYAPSVTSLVVSLVVEQLGVDDRLLLDYAAVLGQGTEDSLVAASHLDGVRDGLLRVAAALPLVSTSVDGLGRRFVVHDLVGEACQSVASLAARDAPGLARTVGILGVTGQASRSLEVALQSGINEIVVEALRSVGPHLLKCAAWELVRAALERVSPEVISSDPTLMMMSAEVAWAEGKKTDAIRQATLAVRLGELSGDEAVPPSARSLLAGMRMSVADFEGAVADLAPFRDLCEMTNAEDLADVLYAAIPAYGFLGDRDGLTRCISSAAQLIADKRVGSYRLARLEMVMGLVADCFDGDHTRSMELMRGAASRMDVPKHWRVRALSNYAACALECGETEPVRAAHAEVAEIGSAFSTALDLTLPSLVAAVADAMESGSGSLRTIVADAIAGCEAEDEVLTLAITCSIASQCTLATGDAENARRISERGLTASAATGSPVLLWLAELEHAQVLLATGEIPRSRAVAQRILPQAQSIQAMGHVLHARLILAEVALRSGDFAQAVEHLAALEDHIARTSPALTLASYVRVFPDLLGALALALGVDALPARFLSLLKGSRGALALQQAAQVLSPSDQAALEKRMRADDERVAEQANAAQADVVCRVRLFGGLQVTTPRGVIGDRDWSKRKARLLFAMLCSRFGTDIPRGEIIEYLWPEMEEERALNNFYVVWSAMKRALSPESVRDNPCPFVEHVRGVCRVVKGHVVSDLDEFTDYLAEARNARHDGDTERELTALRSLADLYRGEVLPGDVYDDWFAPLRDRFKHDFEDCMLRAAEILESSGDPHGGLQILRRAMVADPWREDLYQAQLRLQILAGQRSAAIETYMHCRSRLTEDLGIDPSRETTALYEQVLGMEELADSSR